MDREVYLLFDRNALCQVSRLVNIKTPCNGNIVAYQLKRNYRQRCRKVLIYIRNIGEKVAAFLFLILAVESKPA